MSVGSTNFASTLGSGWRTATGALDRPLLQEIGGAERRWTYRDLVEGSARYANALRRLDVAAGDRVAVQVDKSPEVLLLYFACLRMGAVFLPLNTAYTEPEIDYFLGDAAPSLVACRPGSADAMRALCGKRGIPHCETLGKAGDGTLPELASTCAAEFEDAPRGPDDLAAIVYTSGTTGRSKGAMVTHRNLESNARTLAALWRFTADDVLIHALPIFHVHGLFVALNVTLAAGSSMLFLAGFDAAKVLPLFGRATAMMGVPTFYTRLLAEPALTADSCRGMRLFVSGSAPLLAETHRQWRARTGHAILERYGMTETGMNTSNPYEGERLAGTVGLPLPDVELRIADEGGRVLGRDEIGGIEVRGPNVCTGYWRMPEKTAESFRPDGFFITGDLGTVDAQGIVRIVGRGKDLVISGGYNIYPKEIETEIDAIPGVTESAVFGVPHADFGEGVTAAVVGDAGLTEAAVLRALEGRLARFKQPKRVIFLPDLPRNAMGKVQKAALRERYAGLYEP